MGSVQLMRQSDLLQTVKKQSEMLFVRGEKLYNIARRSCN